MYGLREIIVLIIMFLSSSVSDGELNVLEDILTEAPDQDDELYNPETEREISDKKGTMLLLILLVSELLPCGTWNMHQNSAINLLSS